MALHIDHSGHLNEDLALRLLRMLLNGPPVMHRTRTEDRPHLHLLEQLMAFSYQPRRIHRPPIPTLFES